MNIKLLSTSAKTESAIRNILQSIENADMYCSYLDNPALGWELSEMIERFKKRLEKKINDNF